MMVLIVHLTHGFHILMKAMIGKLLMIHVPYYLAQDGVYLLKQNGKMQITPEVGIIILRLTIQCLSFMLQVTCAAAMAPSAIAVAAATTGVVRRAAVLTGGACTSTVATATCATAARRTELACVVYETDNLTIYPAIPHSGWQGPIPPVAVEFF